MWRTRRGAAQLVTLVAASAALVACAAPADPAPEPADQVEVFGWWASGVEKLAMDALVSQFRADHPDVTYVDGTVAGGAGSVAKDLLASRLANDDPPDVFQVHGGAELASLVQSGEVAPVTALFADGLTDALAPFVRDSVSVDGTPYAVPVAVHRANLLWVNTSVLSAAGLDPSAEYRTLDEWIAAMEAVRAAGYVPLALGATWTQVHLLEVVLLSRLGPEAYAGLWDGTTDARSPEVASALGDFARLLGFTNADRTRLDWGDVTDLVADGEAAFTVMGDWAEPALNSPVVWTPFPGTSDAVDVVVDAFAEPVGAEHPEGATAWLTTCSSPEAQLALTAVKGAVPARGDIPVGSLSAYQTTAHTALVEDYLVPSLAHGMAVSPEALASISAMVDEVAAGTASTGQLQAVLAAAASDGTA